MRPGDSVHVTPQTVHRMTAIEDCDVLEVSTPELDDVVRLEDRYGRVDGSLQAVPAAWRLAGYGRSLDALEADRPVSASV